MVLTEENLTEMTYEFFYKYKKILLLIEKIGFKKISSDLHQWCYKDYYFIFMHSMNGNSGIYDTIYLNKFVDVNFYHNNPNHFKGLKITSTTTDKNGVEVYDINYFELDIHYLTKSNTFQADCDKVISNLNFIFRKELRSLKLKSLFGNGN